MIDFRQIVLACALFGAVPTATFAQSQAGSTSETGTLITRRIAQARGETTPEARRTLREFGACVVATRPGLAETTINTAVDTKPYLKDLNQLMDDECFSSGEMTIPVELLRGATFEALYFREFKDDPKTDIKLAPSFDYSAPYSKPLSEEAQNTIGLAVVADCAARTSPASARALLTSIPGSPVENAAIGEISRILPGCVPSNRTFHFSRSIIRGSVAEALLRLSRSAQRQASAAK